MDVTVFGLDKTDMHRAKLYNYLGIPEIAGSEFQRIARAQVAKFGARIENVQVTQVEQSADGFVVTTEDGSRYQGKYAILAEGKKVRLAEAMGLPRTVHGVEADCEGHTTIDGLYVIGRSASIGRSQAIISAGQGARAAVDILSREAGRDVRDYDEVSDL
jgi:thioredoxin reductase